jgi:hypothetical protein
LRQSHQTARASHRNQVKTRSLKVNSLTALNRLSFW